MQKKLILEEKIEHLLNKEIYPLLKKFPKAEKFSLCQEMKQAFYGLLKSIMMANNIKAKRRIYQEEADAYQKLILVLVSVSYEQKYITLKKKHHLQKFLFEIGGITMYAKMRDGELVFSERAPDRSWLPVEDGRKPEHDSDTQVVSVSRYDVRGDKVVRQYRAEKKPNRQQAVDRLADKIADRILSHLE